ncbi:dihydrolipoamide dehydrogenase [Flavobacteriales bacterium 34_180_T64]|nr:dihydrolipoamide dehydrogenase [Flavobacteriales bacterium 34_180_T64]
MKKLLLIAFVFAISLNVNAQVETPQPSPFTKIEQKVGLTDVTLEYSRPNMRGRTIFGDLVPYGKMWRLGANANTKITFSDDVTVKGQTLKAGSYAIYATPNEKSWDVVFYSDASNWGTPREWDESKVAAKVSAEIYPLPMAIQSFTMGFDDLTNNSATIGMLWENVYVGVTFEVPTDVAVSASIEKTMAGPSANDYFSSAVYYLQEGKDIKQAMTWIDAAVEMTKDKPRFWYMRQQSLIHAKAGDKKGAIKAAKASLAGATEAGNADYIKMNNESLKEWGAM